MATAAGRDERKEVLGLDLLPTEDGAGWTAFRRSPPAFTKTHGSTAPRARGAARSTVQPFAMPPSVRNLVQANVEAEFRAIFNRPPGRPRRGWRGIEQTVDTVRLPPELRRELSGEVAVSREEVVPGRHPRSCEIPPPDPRPS